MLQTKVEEKSNIINQNIQHKIFIGHKMKQPILIDILSHNLGSFDKF